MEQISDPPGSSRNKRRSPLSVSLNAYLGGTFGHEIWSGEALTKTEDFYSLAATMPIGITLSRLFGRKKSSFSLFISFLDIGALLSYQPSSVQQAEADFTFKNVFKPGLQAHWNIKKSPFYIGLGWQSGRQFIKANDVKRTVSSNRTFVAFGVDVPIRTLYQK